MKAADLRKSILQAAVQGRLVPQDKNDEPASELLKRIQAEKATLIKAGKLKKEKPLPPITENEIPYDLPDGWVWCRINDVAIINPRNTLPDDLEVTFLPMALISQEYFGGHKQEKKQWKEVKSGFTHFVEGDILLAKITPCFQNRKSCIASNLVSGFGAGTTELHVLRCILLVPQYLFIFIRNPYFIEEAVKNMTGTAGQQRVPAEYLRRFLLPLPPKAEQQRIASKVNELMALCDELEAAEKEQAALEKHLAEDLPKSILQAAVQGKLVPQDKDDEPASELLKRVQAEKVALIKAGKLKKEKPLPPITEDEIPYDLPDGWVWCRLRDIGEIIGGATPDSSNPSYYTSPMQGIAWITPADMKYAQDSCICHGMKDITQAGFDSCSTKLLPAGSIIFSSRAPIGHIAFAKTALCTNQGFKSIVPYNFGNASWIFLALKSKIEDINSRASGTTFKEVSGSFMEKELIPLPPIAEQQRIVAKVNELMSLCDELKHAYDQPVLLNNIPLSNINENELEEEPLQMAAQGKINAQPSSKHAEALRQLQGMMQDE